uniref:Glycosyltransferase n=1 Tax=viral metagenome TaxID=1070528 RepID=A0A6C0ARY3_9ZZZZ
MPNKNILIYPHDHFNMGSGGITVHYYLAKLLDDNGEIVRMHPCKGSEPNSLFSKYYNDDFPVDDDCVVIYCEGIEGNPLKAKNVVRWMLSALGQNVPYDRVHDWGKNELVYFFNSEKMINNCPDKVGSLYKYLTIIFLDPNMKVYVPPVIRYHCCYTIRKLFIHGKAIETIHPPESFEIGHYREQNAFIDIFNNHEIFVSYDPLTFLSIMAPMCGCVSIVYPIEGVTEMEWLKMTAAKEYVEKHNISKLYGVSYGTDSVEWAKSTLHLVRKQWEDIINYYITAHLPSFIQDINNFETMQNTIDNIYFESNSI